MLCIVAFEGWHCQPGRAGKALSVSSLFQYHEVNMTKKKTNKNKQIQLAFEGWHCHCQARGKMCLCYNLFIVFPNFVMQRYIRKHCQRHNRLRELSQSSQYYWLRAKSQQYLWVRTQRSDPRYTLVRWSNRQASWDDQKSHLRIILAKNLHVWISCQFVNFHPSIFSCPTTAQ